MKKYIHAPYALLFAQDNSQHILLKRYIQNGYTKEFNATIPHFLPYLLGLYRADGLLIGACGINRADFGDLYLERYLDAPIEAVIATQTGEAIARDRLVEIGNFACSESGNARIMFAALCQLLCENKLDYVAFTGTRKLRNIFHRLNLMPLELAPALAAKMGEEADAWGDYYQNNPCVMIGNLKQGRQILSQTSLLLSLFSSMPCIFPVQTRILP